jgi:hypothetical protein
LIFEWFIPQLATEKERGREIRTATEKEREEERSITHAHRPATEKDRGRENWPEYMVFRPDLSISGQREMPSVGFGRIRPETQTTSPDLAGNVDDLARSGRKHRQPLQIRLETHAHRRGFDRSGTPSSALSHVIPIPLFRLEISSSRIAFCFTLRVVVRPAGVQICDVGFRRAVRLLGENEMWVQIRIILTCFSIRIIFFRRV